MIILTNVLKGYKNAHMNKNLFFWIVISLLLMYLEPSIVIHGSLGFFYKAYLDRKTESDMIVKCWCQRQYVYILFFGHQ